MPEEEHIDLDGTSEPMRPRLTRRSCCCLLILLLAIAGISIGAGFLHLLDMQRYVVLSRAKGTLRSISSAQLHYQEENENKSYGSFQDLVRAGEISEGYTLGNMIEKYSMTWEVNNVSTAPTEEFPTGVRKTFTIIAWPNYETYLLSTFAITEDQVVRVYNPGEGNELDDVKTWDPIL